MYKIYEFFLRALCSTVSTNNLQQAVSWLVVDNSKDRRAWSGCVPGCETTERKTKTWSSSSFFFCCVFFGQTSAWRSQTKERGSAYIVAEVLGTAKNKNEIFFFSMFLINTVRQFDYGWLIAIEVSGLSSVKINRFTIKTQERNNTFFFSIFTTHFKITCVKTATIKNEALYKRVYRYLGYIVLIIICILYISYTIVMCHFILELC